MGRNNKVVKLNKTIKINAATCVIAAILLYVIICIIQVVTKEPITVYRVNKSNVSNNIILEGIAVRDEEIIKTTRSGYVCYYIRDGEKIKKNSTVCTVDETGQVYSSISDVDSYNDLFTKQDYNDVREIISLYKVSYDDDSFYNAYNFENNVNNKVLELTNEILMQQVNNSSSYGLSGVTSPYSGLVTYYTDGYEDFDITKVKAEDFDKSKYSKQTLKTGDIISAGSSIVKIIPSEKWNIVAPITQEQINIISSSEYVRIKINNSSYDIVMPYTIINGADGQYINISLDKYLYNFVSERFLTVEIIKQEDEGLKIPVSSIVEKDSYKIPLNYLTGGGNDYVNNKIYINYMDEKGELSVRQVDVNIIKYDEEYVYVDPSSFQPTDVIKDIDSDSTIAVSLLEINKLQGVYSVNRGTAEFRPVTVIKTVDEFALIESDEEISVYDNIVLDSSKVVENQIIY